jgi:hypothetical protein
MERSALRKKVILDLLTSPWALAPGVGGLSLLILAGAAGGGPLLVLGGIGGVLAGVGALLTRWIWNSEDITRKAFDQLQAEAARQEEAALDDLQRRLEQDDDPRTDETLARLRALYARARQNTAWAGKMDQRSALEIAAKVEALFRGCVHSLERSLEFWEVARRMSTAQARKSVLEGRERLLDEINKSTEQLARTLDEVQALAVQKRREQDLARVRQELDESLAVARRVEERMLALDAELGRTAVQSERE